MYRLGETKSWASLPPGRGGGTYGTQRLFSAVFRCGVESTVQCVSVDPIEKMPRAAQIGRRNLSLTAHQSPCGMSSLSALPCEGLGGATLNGSLQSALEGDPSSHSPGLALLTL